MENPALSTQAIKQNYNQNRYKYNGIEYDTAFGLDYYEALYRDLDPKREDGLRLTLKLMSGMSRFPPILPCLMIQ
jgi:hypothetical protein